MYIKSLEVKVYDNSDDVTQISRGEAVLILDSDTFYYYGDDNNLKVMRTKESFKDEIISEYLENTMKSVDSQVVEVPIDDDKDFITIEKVKRILEGYATIEDLNKVKKDISKVKRRKIVVTEVYDEDDSEEKVDNLVEEESTTEAEIDEEAIDEDTDGDIIEDTSDLLN